MPLAVYSALRALHISTHVQRGAHVYWRVGPTCHQTAGVQGRCCRPRGEGGRALVGQPVKVSQHHDRRVRLHGGSGNVGRQASQQAPGCGDDGQHATQAAVVALLVECSKASWCAGCCCAAAHGLRPPRHAAQQAGSRPMRRASEKTKKGRHGAYLVVSPAQAFAASTCLPACLPRPRPGRRFTR